MKKSSAVGFIFIILIMELFKMLKKVLIEIYLLCIGTWFLIQKSNPIKTLMTKPYKN